MARGDRRKCKCCHKLFRPDPRNRRHQSWKSFVRGKRGLLSRTAFVMSTAPQVVKGKVEEEELDFFMGIPMAFRAKHKSLKPCCFGFDSGQRVATTEEARLYSRVSW